MGLLQEEKSIVFKKEEPKEYRTLRMTFEDDFDKTIKEITVKSEFSDGISFCELMNTFRQFVLMLGYSEDTAKMIRDFNEADLEMMGLSKEDIAINEYE